MDYATGDADVLAIHSDDGGATWSKPVRVNDDAEKNGKDQLMPAGAISPNGDLHVVFYDRRDDPGNKLLHVYWTVSEDGGETWARNARVTTAASDAKLSFHQTGVNFMGDYIGVASARDGEAWVAWADTREGRADVFVAKIAK
jgi:Neuraminidase (sialidase)